VVSIDMEMPKECYRCPLLDGEYGTCNIIGETKVDMTEERAKNCPLVEIGTCKDCKHLCDWHNGRSKGLYCGLHTEADFCFEVEENFYCAYFEKGGEA
jgi:hypothetical protein